MNTNAVACDKEERWFSGTPLNHKHTNMKKAILLVLSSVTLMSCASGPGTQQGAVIGALVGAGAGGIIGNQSGRGLEGAAIGAAAGALGGAAIGNAKDKRNAQGGYYDRNGRWVPAQPQNAGYYDRSGRWHYY